MKISRKYKNSKVGILEYLNHKLTLFKVPKLIKISFLQWYENDIHTIKIIKENFPSTKLVVRSTYSSEDDENNTMAGEFASILNVSSNSSSELKTAIETVFDSYKKKGKLIDTEEIFIQEMVKDVAMSGVIFTHDLNSGAPYYVFNYDDISGRTDLVTSGDGEYSNRTLYVFREAIDKLRSERFRVLTESVQELEKLLDSQFLDIEFALDKNLKPYLLQVRSISTKPNWNRALTLKINKELEGIKNFVKNKFNTQDEIYGSTTSFGQMPDWNPAEMLGRSPRALSLSLYSSLITNYAWRDARKKCGYKIPRGQPLMISLAGQPFIDTRLSFNSFLPRNLDDSISEKLVNSWVNKLKENPHLHDKIEFEIATTCFNFDINRRFEEYHFLNLKEKDTYKKSLLDLTLSLISGKSKGSIENAMEKIYHLDKISKNNNMKFSNMYCLISDCINYGTIPFAILARHGFIAKEILLSFYKRGAITFEELTNFQKSIKTVASELLEDMSNLQSEKITYECFIKKYGHLRPGTYDILSTRYDKQINFGKGRLNIKFREKNNFDYKLSNKVINNINQLLNENKITSINADSILNYCKRAIKAREFAKFVFTKHVSKIIELIAEFGESHGLTREEMSHIPISHLLNYLSSSSINIESKLRDISLENSEKNYLASAIRLPQILNDENDVYVIPFQVSHPNFITNKKVISNIVYDNLDQKLNNIENHIVLIENADPGYDWIFSQRIAGLITKYGGANSHMAIRCAEFGIPAAIGCGEQRFEYLSKSNQIVLDCNSGSIYRVH